MAPMIDMVFLLLVFFMCVSTLVQSERGIELALPDSTESEVPKDITARRIVSIDAEGKLFLARDELKLSDLKKVLIQELGQTPELRVQIRADQNTHYRYLKNVMNLCAEIGIFDIVYATFQS